MRPDALTRARVLAALKLCQGYWLEESTLLIQLNLSRPDVSTAALAAVLRDLREKDYLDFRVEEISGAREWKLTSAGVVLAQPIEC